MSETVVARPAVLKSTSDPNAVEVICIKQQGQKWGLDLILNETETLRSLEVMKVKEGGYFENWNKNNPSTQLVPGVRVLEVNGYDTETEPMDEVVKQFQMNHRLAMMIIPHNSSAPEQQT